MSQTASSKSLVVGLVRSAILWALPILIFTSVALTWFYRSSTYRIFDDPMSSAVTSLIAAANVPDNGDLALLDLVREPTDPRYQQALSGRYWLVGTMGEDGKIVPLESSRSLYGETLQFNAYESGLLNQSRGEQTALRAVGPDGEPLRVIAREVTLPNAAKPVVILAAIDSRPASQAVRRFAYLASALMLLLSAGLVTAVFTQVRLGLRPLFALRDTVADVREGRTTRVDGIYPPEIQPLATELNFLIDHNRDVVEHARTHVGNLAHALKTPLAVLVNESENVKAKDKAFSSIVQRQTETMRNQVDHHLRRARAAARGHTIGVSTDVDTVISSLARTLPRIYRSKDIDLSAYIAEGLSFRGEQRDLEEMAGNLMDNACKWTVSEVQVKAIANPDDETSLIISVEDDGPGLKEADYVTALKRGARLDEATPGTGFGLAIVDDLARAYKGRLELSRSDMGGLCVTLILPMITARTQQIT